MERMYPSYNPEKEKSPELKKMKHFFIESLPLTDEGEKKLVEKDAASAFRLYQDFINTKADFKHFLKINELNNDESKKEILQDELNKELWLKYLINKLPRALVQRQLEIQKVNDEEDFDYQKLEKIHQQRDYNGRHMILGMHVSPQALTGNQINVSKIPTTLILGGKKIEIPAGHAFYSITNDSLYKTNGYLSFIEGDEYELKHEKEKRGMAHGGGKWITTSRQIPTLSKSFKLDDEIINALGLSRNV